MKNKDLRKLAILGIASGVLVSNGLSAANPINNTLPNHKPTKTNGIVAFNDEKDVADTAKEYDPNDGNIGYHDMTEDELLLELDDNGTAMYKSLSPEGKELARKVASMRCNKTNECKGLNACQTEKNACAGKGACKGQGKCAIADKNLAVKLVRDKMAQKRENAASPSQKPAKH